VSATITGWSQVDEIEGANKIVKKKEFHAVSHPSETYFAFREPVQVTVDDAKLRADQVSDTIEAIASNGWVTGISYSQDVAPTGRLLDMWTIYYSSTDGEKDGWVTVNYADFTPAVVLGDISNALDT
jgi:hypothetical protein